MSPEELKAYKRDKSKKFNAHLRDLRLKEKKRIADQQDGNQDDNLQRNQEDQQPDNTIDKQDELSLQDVMDIFETLDTKLDLIQTKLENKLENKIDELFNRLDTIESIIETKLENKLETNQPINRQPSIFFA